MNTKEILTEWRSFLKENKEFTEEKYNIGEKVKIEICCDGCGKSVTPSNNYIKKGVSFFGTIKKNSGPKDVTFSGEDKPTKVNMLEIDCDGKIFNFPQCCVNLGVKSQEKENKTPSNINTGDTFFYQGEECKIIQNDLRGTRVLISINDKEKSVDYNSLYNLGK